MPEDVPTVFVSPRRVVRFLWICLATMVAIHVALQILRLGFGRDVVFGLTGLFDLDRESNVPTWFSGFLLGLAAALLGLIGAHHVREKHPMGRRWEILGWIFAYLSLDEIARVHERGSKVLQRMVSTDQTLHFLWTLPAVVLLIGLYVAYRPWFRDLEPRVRRGIMIAAAVYLTGAVGMELVGGAYWAWKGVETLDTVYTIITTVEETLEMVGALMFVQVLLGYASARKWGVVVAQDLATAASRQTGVGPAS